MAILSINSTVIKSNPIIEGNFPKGLTSREMDLLTVLFTTVDTKSDDMAIVRINMKDLIRIYGLEASKSSYERIYEVSERLLSRVIQVKNDGQKTLTQYQILSMAKYHYGEGYADFKFNAELRPFLLDLQQYAKYMLRYFLALDSFYAKRIYELIVQYRNMKGAGNSWRRQISLNDIRPFLGIEHKEYKLYGHFKSRVLIPSVLQINGNTDISLEYEEIKLGRRVDAILFIATEKAEPPALLEVAPDPTAGRDFQRLLSYGIDDATARELVKKHPADVVAYNLEALDGIRKSPRGERIENPAGWLIAGIRSNRGEQLNLLNSPAPTQASKYDEAKRKEARKAELAEIIRGVMGSYRDYRKKLVEAYLSAGYEEELKASFTDFMKAKIGPVNAGPLAYALGQFQKSGWFDTLAIPHVAEFFIRRGSTIMTIEEFATKKGVPNYGEISEELKQLEKGA